MMMDRAQNPDRHLTPDEVELFTLGLPARPRSAETHLAACLECRSEVESLQALHRALSSLEHFAPAPAFAERVMARVTLPVPWRARAWTLARERWLPVAAALVAVLGATSLTALWLGNQPELSVGGVLELMSREVREFGLQVVMTAGGLLWNSAIVRSMADGIVNIGLEGAILLLSALSLVTISAAAAMARLVQPTPLRIGHTGQ
ncbi:MAG: hypothetical protein KAJ67_06560 [Gemmatimonadetes bacterium]|nr:hypothetical protein [Gemmatimonadota bacterium]